MVSDNLLEHRLGTVEQALGDIRTTLKGIHDSLMALTRLEERHRESKEALARAFERIETAESRISAIELALPTLKLTSGWMLRLMWGIFALVGVAVIKLVVVGL